MSVAQTARRPVGAVIEVDLEQPLGCSTMGKPAHSAHRSGPWPLSSSGPCAARGRPARCSAVCDECHAALPRCRRPDPRADVHRKLRRLQRLLESGECCCRAARTGVQPLLGMPGTAVLIRQRLVDFGSACQAWMQSRSTRSTHCKAQSSRPRQPMSPPTQTRMSTRKAAPSTPRARTSCRLSFCPTTSCTSGSTAPVCPQSLPCLNPLLRYPHPSFDRVAARQGAFRGWWMQACRWRMTSMMSTSGRPRESRKTSTRTRTQSAAMTKRARLAATPTLSMQVRQPLRLLWTGRTRLQCHLGSPKRRLRTATQTPMPRVGLILWIEFKEEVLQSGTMTIGGP